MTEAPLGIYRPSRSSRKQLLAALSIVLVVSVVGLAISYGAQPKPPSAWPLIFVAVLGGVALVFLHRTTRLVLYPHAIGLRQLGRERRLEASEIAGIYSSGRFPSGTTRLIIPRSRKVRPILDLDAFETDSVLNAWIARLPLIDASHNDAIAAPGNTVAERGAWISGWRRNSRLLTAASGCLLLAYWSQIADPWLAFLLTGFPLIALAVVATSRGAIVASIEDRRRDSRQSVGLAITVSTAALFWGRPGYVNVVNYSGLVLPGVLLAALLFTIFVRIDRSLRESLKSRAFYLILFTLHSGTACISLNILLDSSTGVAGTATIIATHEYHRRLPEDYAVTIDSWGPIRGSRVIRVPKARFEHFHPGEAACTELHPGALGAAWYTVSACR